MKKIVINECYGGFGLSKEAYEYMGLTWDGYGYAFSNDEERESEKLISCIEELGYKASGCFAKLEIKEYDDENYIPYITEYDGFESLKLMPLVREKKLRECNSTSQIINYLKELGIAVSEEDD